MPKATILKVAPIALLLVPLMLMAPGRAALPAETSSGPTLVLAEDALAAMAARKWKTARRLIAKVPDPVIAKLLTWRLLSRPRSNATFKQIAAFVEANPDWPLQWRLAEQAEFAIVKGTPDAVIIAWFEKNPPVSFNGLLRFIDALHRHGQTLGAAVLARRHWIEETFRARRAKTFFRKYRRLLRKEDHAARLEALLWKGHVNSARRLLKSIDFDAGTKRLAEARLLLKSRQTRGKNGRRQVARALARVPAALRDDPGLLYDRIRWSRRNNRDEEARKLLLSAPEIGGHGRLWWRERNIQIRDSLLEGDPAGAYALARGHRQSSGVELVEAEWMAGWIALRSMNRPEQAFSHFTRLYLSATSPISRSRGAYWLGRAAEAWERKDWAQQWYSEAARYATTFYGQFATERLGGWDVDLPRDPTPSPELRRSFESRELVRAARALHRLGQIELVKPFLIRLRNQADTPEAWVMVAALALDLEQTPAALRTGKWAARNSHVLVNAAYPIIRMAAQTKVELPLLLALIRQESEFEAEAVSPAGARGLMQLMPATARRTAKSLRMKYVRKRLTADPGYNIKLGTAYLAQMIERYDGSYVLALAAYNAGPQNVAAWIKKLGDPRADGGDIVDWIESIPFGETRNYVQRILESLQTYRALFGDNRLAAAAPGELWRQPAQIASAGDNARCVANAIQFAVPPPC